MKKNRITSGETLVETLAAILLTTMSGVLFLQMTLASARIGGETKDMDARYRQMLNAAEEQQTSFEQGTVTVGDKSYEVDYYSYDTLEDDTAGMLVSYSVREGS